MYTIVKTVTRAKEDVFVYGRYDHIEDAQKELLGLYNTLFRGERIEAPNWGVAVAQTIEGVWGAHKTYNDGTREFSYDGNTSYRIVSDKELKYLEEDYHKRLV